MDLIKVKGIVIRETTYKDNDKIITLLTDKLGKISCMAKGAKKNNSPILANCQYLVYSEFVLYKSKNFYMVNSASIINMFYKFRVNFDKMECAFELTRIINLITDENEDTESVLKLFLNTIYVLENGIKSDKMVIPTFKIKLFAILGFSPNIAKCSQCGQVLINNDENLDFVYYDYVSNLFLCNNCIQNKDLRRYIKISGSTAIAIKYIIVSDIKKVFNFELKDYQDLNNFALVYTDTMINGL